jgi:RHS repeat-associated protein
LLGDLTYEYDKAGNRTKVGGSWARTGMPQSLNTTSYDAANRQLTFGDKTLTYDDNGNLTTITDSSGTTIYQWNARNQLSGISGPNVNASFVYDGVGRREKKTINGNLTEFLYDGVNPVQETSGAAVLVNTLTGLGIDEFLTRTDVSGGTVSHFLAGALGSTLAMADSTGAVPTEYTYEPFGKATQTGASSSNPLQYTGRESDGTGLYFYRARYYDSILQRFVTEDPAEFEGGDYNLYAFVGNNPINSRDPTGNAADITSIGAEVTAEQFRPRLGAYPCFSMLGNESPKGCIFQVTCGKVIGFVGVAKSEFGRVCNTQCAHCPRQPHAVHIFLTETVGPDNRISKKWRVDVRCFAVR